MRHITIPFLDKTPVWHFCLMSWPAYASVVVRRHKVRQSHLSRTLWPRIIKFYVGTHTDLFYIHTRYDVTYCFRSEVLATKTIGIAAPTTSGGISQFYMVIADVLPHKPAEYVTSLAVSSRLQNAIKYCTKVRKTAPACHRVIIRPLFNLELPILYGHPAKMPKTIPAMTSLATSGHYLSKFEKWPEMSHPTAWGRITPERFKRHSRSWIPKF